MILSRYKYKIIISALIILLIPRFSIAEGAYNEWNYNVLEESSSFVDIDRTTADIDYDSREIKLPKLPVSDVIKFTNDEGYDYVVLEKDGFQHYGFDGENMVPINSLSKKDIESPLGIAYDPYQPSYFVSQLSEEGGVIKNYVHSESGMKENPILTTLNLDYIYSLSTFESGELTVLTEDSIKTYAKDENDLIYLPALSKEEIEDPISIAAGQGYRLAVLTKEKIEYYEYKNEGISVPTFELLLDKEVKNPKAIVLDGERNTTFLLDEKEVMAYTLEGQSMTYNAGFSIKNNLNKPQAMAFNRGTKDILIIDEMDTEDEEGRFIAKYFMYDGEEYVELKQLSQSIEEIAIGNRYHQEGFFITNTFSTNSSYIDLLRVRAFTETPKGTEMEFFMTYDVDAFKIGENNGDDHGEDVGEEIEWIPLWKVTNDSSDDVNSGSIYMGRNNLGNNEVAYPTTIYEEISEDEGFITDEDIKVDENGNLVIDVGKDYESSFWKKLDIGDKREAIDSGKYKSFRIKVVFKTIDSEVTPKIFAPIGTNNESKITESDGIAFKIEGNAEPLGPIIDVTDPNIEDNPIPPDKTEGEMPKLPDRIGFNPVEGWIYTTTPMISWEFIDEDLEHNEYEQQIAYQVVLLANTHGDWRVAYDTGIVDGERGMDNWMKIPTTIDNLYKNGPMWETGTNHFLVTIRTWDINGAVSDFYLEEGNEFRVLAFERPRIVNVVYPIEEDADGTKQPTLNDISSHRMITPGMKESELPYAKAGSEVTLYLDSVGPIITDPSEVGLFYVNIQGQNTPMFISESNYEVNGNNGTWTFKFFTNAPIDIIPDDTIVKGSFVGESRVGGTTVLYIPNYADGIITTKETIYKDWQVIIQGRDK